MTKRNSKPDPIVLFSQPDATDNPTPGLQEAVGLLSQPRTTEAFLSQTSQSANPPHFQKTPSTPASESLRDPSLIRPSEFNRDSSPSTLPSANSKGPEYGKYINALY